MSDKKANWGQKAAEQPGPDPREFIFGQDNAGEPKQAPAPDSGGRHSRLAPDDAATEPMVRITVDVRKSVHKQLQRICNERDEKLAPFIRKLIERELTKLQKSQ